MSGDADVPCGGMMGRTPKRAWVIAWAVGLAAVGFPDPAAGQPGGGQTAAPQGLPKRTDLALGVIGDLELGGLIAGGGNVYATLNVGGRLDFVPTLPFVGQVAYEKNIGSTSGPNYLLTVGTGLKFADQVGTEGAWVATGAGQVDPQWSFVRFEQVAALTRHYQVLRGGLLRYEYGLGGSTQPVRSNGFFVGYSRNTLVNAKSPSSQGAGLPGLRALNSLALDLAVGGVSALSPKQNKVGFRGVLTLDFGNIASQRFEAGLRPGLGYYGVYAVEVFFLASRPWM